LKTRSAFLLSCKRLAKSRATLFLWTLTFPDSPEYGEAMHRLRILLQNLSRSCGMFGLRVIELHPGGHGIHFHLLCRVFVPVQVVRRYALRAGFGRIHVCRIEAERVSYVCKHFTKQRRLGIFKRKRLWAAFGFDHCRIKDMTTNSRQLEVFRKLNAALCDSSPAQRMLAWYEAGRLCLAEIRAGCLLYGASATNLVLL